MYLPRVLGVKSRQDYRVQSAAFDRNQKKSEGSREKNSHRGHGEHRVTECGRNSWGEAVSAARPGAACGHRLDPDSAGKRASIARTGRPEMHARFPAEPGPRRCNTKRWPLPGSRNGLTQELRPHFVTLCSQCPLWLFFLCSLRFVERRALNPVILPAFHAQNARQIHHRI